MKQSCTHSQKLLTFLRNKKVADKVCTQGFSREANKAYVTTYQKDIFNAYIIQEGMVYRMREMVLCNQREK